MSLKVRSISDLHLEFYTDSFRASLESSKVIVDKILPPLDSDLETVLILNGDVATTRKTDILKNLFKLLVPRFKHIIYVLGNHEHYHGNIFSTFPIIEDLLQNTLQDDYSKITLAGNDPVKVEIDGVIFACGTLWTDYAGKNATSVHNLIERYISDHRAIRDIDNQLLKVPRLIKIHQNTLKLFGQWMDEDKESPFVICTHHMPSFSAVDPQYMTDDPITRTLNHAFASDLDEFIKHYQPTFWTFGHTHTKYFGKIGVTQLICNPHGYPAEKNISLGIFDKYNMFEVQKQYDRRKRECHRY